jgi:hypothetical protein
MAEESAMSDKPKNTVYRNTDIHAKLDDHQPMLVTRPDGTAVMVSPTTPLATTVGYTPKLQWMVRYSDGDVLYQLNSDGSEQPTKIIERKKLRSFIMLRRDDHQVVFALEFQPGHEFIYRTRTALQNGGVTEKIHVVGWRKKVEIGGRSEYISNINFVYESDYHIESGDFLFEEEEGYGNVEQWRYPPEFIDDDYIVIE